MTPLTLIGKVVAIENKPSTAYSFNFWASDDSKVGIGTLVKVIKGDLSVYGIVTDGVGFTDLGSAMHDYIGCEGDPGLEAATVRPEVRCYTASVLRVDPEEPLQPVPVAPVYLADDDAVCAALRMDYKDKTGIPVGLYQNGDELSPVYLDSEFLLGPEAAHLNITGVSGLATKTSTIEFMLSGIFAHYKEDIAVVCFNVKGSDMLFLDYPATLPKGHELEARYADAGVGGIEEEDFGKYAKLDVPCKAFDNVRYYAPFKADRFNLNTLRSNEELADNVYPLSWNLEDVIEYSGVFLNRDDIDAKADALISYIQQRVVGRKVTVGDKTFEVHDFAELNAWFDAVKEFMEDNEKPEYKTHHIATIRKVSNRLSNLVNRYKGLISPDTTHSDLPWDEGFRDRHIYVVDVAKQDAQAQDLVFTRVVSKLRERLEAKKLGVGHVIVVVDELNKYAPSDGSETYLKKTLLEISERGRYLGLVLFSAQQFRSQVQKRVVGNSASFMYGRMDVDELATPGYQVLGSSVKEKLATLSKGQMMVRHPHFNQPIFIKFPRPNILRGPDGIKVFPPEEELPLAECVYRHLSKLDKDIRRNDIKDAIVGVDEEKVVEAMNKVVNDTHKSEKPLVYFKSFLPRKPKEETIKFSDVRSDFVNPDPDDPFAY